VLAAGTVQIATSLQGPPGPATPRTTSKALFSASVVKADSTAVVDSSPVSEAPQRPNLGRELEPEPTTTGSLFQPSGTPAEPLPSESFMPAPAAVKRIPGMASIGKLPAGLPAALREAVLDGDPAAVYEFAARTAEGRGLPRDPALAARLFEKAAESGLPPAQYRIANLYEKGLGVARDAVRAKSWYKRAAESGNARAMHNLAVLLAEGVDGKPDLAAALHWFVEAAEFGIRDSQFNLGVLLARGLGTRQDLARSYQWFALAAAQGDDEAGRKRDEVGARLSAAELAAAKMLVEQWRARTANPAANEVASSAQGWSAVRPQTTTGQG